MLILIIYPKKKEEDLNKIKINKIKINKKKHNKNNHNDKLLYIIISDVFYFFYFFLKQG